MMVLLVGAGRVGAKTIRQLNKNPKTRIITVDPRETPFALKEGLIDSVDYLLQLNPNEIISVIKKVKPDLVLVTTSKEDIGRTGIPGLEVLVESLKNELESTAEVPIIAVARN
jgi:hypothetical protein